MRARTDNDEYPRNRKSTKGFFDPYRNTLGSRIPTGSVLPTSTGQHTGRKNFYLVGKILSKKSLANVGEVYIADSTVHDGAGKGAEYVAFLKSIAEKECFENAKNLLIHDSVLGQDCCKRSQRVVGINAVVGEQCFRGAEHVLLVQKSAQRTQQLAGRCFQGLKDFYVSGYDISGESFFKALGGIVLANRISGDAFKGAKDLVVICESMENSYIPDNSIVIARYISTRGIRESENVQDSILLSCNTTSKTITISDREFEQIRKKLDIYNNTEFTPIVLHSTNLRDGYQFDTHPEIEAEFRREMGFVEECIARLARIPRIHTSLRKKF